MKEYHKPGYWKDWYWNKGGRDKVQANRKKRSELVEQVAFVNKVPYFVEVNNPERVYTLLEIWRPKKK